MTSKSLNLAVNIIFMSVLQHFVVITEPLYYLTYCKLSHRFTSLGPSKNVRTVEDAAFLRARGLWIKGF